MATEECFCEVSPTSATHNNRDTNCMNSHLETGTLLVRPWTTIPVPLSEDMDKDSEVRSLLKSDHYQTRFSYPVDSNTNKAEFEPLHRLSPTLSSTSSCNDNNDTPFPKRLDFLSSSFSPVPRIVRRRKHRICSWFYGWGHGFLTALFLFGCAFLLTFLLGLLIGYYVKVGGRIDGPTEQISGDASTGDNIKEEEWTPTQNCYQTHKFLRRCKPDPRLDSIHGNIMYYVNGDRMTEYISKFPTHFSWQSDQEWDGEMTEHLRREFALQGLDKVEVFNYNVAASSPNPDSPRQLELTDVLDRVKLNVQLKSLVANEKGSGSNQFYNVYSSQSGDNVFKACLFFANYGTSADLNHLKNLGANLTNQMVLLRTGKLSIQEKLVQVQREGVRGVLFYSDFDGNVDVWEKENNISEPFFISSYAKDNFHGEPLDSLPNVKQLSYVYNISSSLALQILSVLGETTLQKNGSNHSNTSRHHSGDPISITLKFDSSLKTVMVSNVVGTLYGINQPDEQVFVGSHRFYGASDHMNHTSVGHSGTAMLLELLHSLLHVRDIEGWQPQRTIKFVSWGTATGNDNAGIQEYLKKNSWIVNSRNVGYVELEDVDGKWCNHLFIHADSVSLETVIQATQMVPDPANPESSISMRYKSTKSDPSSTSNARHESLTSQLVDEHTLKMSHWVPTVQFSCVYSTKSQQPSKFDNQTTSERNHHYRHHMAVTRVASLVLLALADKDRYGYSIKQLISAVQHEISHFLTSCHGVSFKSVDKAMSALLEMAVRAQHPVTLKIWQGLTQASAADQHFQWLIHNCQNQLLLLHRILAPLTRLNSSSISLESLSLEDTGSIPPISCSTPVLTMITQKLEQAFYSLSD